VNLFGWLLGRRSYFGNNDFLGPFMAEEVSNIVESVMDHNGHGRRPVYYAPGAHARVSAMVFAQGCATGRLLAAAIDRELEAERTENPQLAEIRDFGT
jgi:hypothetical protein